MSAKVNSKKVKQEAKMLGFLLSFRFCVRTDEQNLFVNTQQVSRLIPLLRYAHPILARTTTSQTETYHYLTDGTIPTNHHVILKSTSHPFEWDSSEKVKKAGHKYEDAWTRERRTPQRDEQQ